MEYGRWRSILAAILHNRTFRSSTLRREEELRPDALVMPLKLRHEKGWLRKHLIVDEKAAA